MQREERTKLNQADTRLLSDSSAMQSERFRGLSAKLERAFAVWQFGSANVLILLGCASLLVGGWAPWAVLLFALVAGSFADEASGDSRDTIEGTCVFCNINLYASLPLVLVMAILLVRFATEPVSLGQQIGAVYLVGYLFALVGATVAHELTHRQSTFAQISAYILLGFTFNPSFVIYHVYGHHRYVGSYDDPSTARRGERPLRSFIPRTILQQFTHAWRIEAERLRRRGLSAWSWRNRLILAQLVPIVIVALAALAGGWNGATAMIGAGLTGRLFHELVNYVQHYGVVRVENSPIRPHHSWDCYRRISNALHYNLPRHADHHMFATKSFWRLNAVEAAPTLPFGYQTMATIALLPPVWRHIMRPLLKDWDERFASGEERHLVRKRGWDGIA
jgi:alkane 1-monooxygenase